MFPIVNRLNFHLFDCWLISAFLTRCIYTLYSYRQYFSLRVFLLRAGCSGMFQHSSPGFQLSATARGWNLHFGNLVTNYRDVGRQGLRRIDFSATRWLFWTTRFFYHFVYAVIKQNFRHYYLTRRCPFWRENWCGITFGRWGFRRRNFRLNLRACNLNWLVLLD